VGYYLFFPQPSTGKETGGGGGGWSYYEREEYTQLLVSSFIPLGGMKGGVDAKMKYLLISITISSSRQGGGGKDTKTKLRSTQQLDEKGGGVKVFFSQSFPGRPKEGGRGLGALGGREKNGPARTFLFCCWGVKREEGQPATKREEKRGEKEFFYFTQHLRWIMEQREREKGGRGTGFCVGTPTAEEEGEWINL